MKEGIVPTVLKALVDYEFEPTRTSDYASADSARRDFSFTRPATDIFLKVTVEVFAKLVETQDATCRKVQTGVKLVETPTFELVCD